MKKYIKKSMALFDEVTKLINDNSEPHVPLPAMDVKVMEEKIETYIFKMENLEFIGRQALAWAIGTEPNDIFEKTFIRVYRRLKRKGMGVSRSNGFVFRDK